VALLKHLILVIALSNVATGVVFQNQAVQIPSGEIRETFEDINGNGLKDLLVLVQDERKLLIYPQGNDGFSAKPSQTIDLGNARWISICDVNGRAGKELIVSTEDGLSYFTRKNGIFQSPAQALLKFRQAVYGRTWPMYIDFNKRPGVQRHALPLVTEDKTILYSLEPNYCLLKKTELQHNIKRSMYRQEDNNWSANSRDGGELVFTTTAAYAEADASTDKKNDLTRRRDRSWFRSGQESRDLDGDGLNDLIAWNCSGDIDWLTRIMIYIRQKNGDLPQSPTMSYRFKGMPFNIDSSKRQAHIFTDLGDGNPVIVLASLTSKPLSAGSIADAVISRGLDLTITGRAYKPGKGFENKPDFSLDVTVAIPMFSSPDDLLKFKGDFNGDGRKDLVVRRDQQKLEIYLSNGSGYDNKPGLVIEMPQWSFEVDDLNRDGISDIYGHDYRQDKINIVLSKRVKGVDK
jgi:hypothetical protein